MKRNSGGLEEKYYLKSWEIPDGTHGSIFDRTLGQIRNGMPIKFLQYLLDTLRNYSRNPVFKLTKVSFRNFGIFNEIFAELSSYITLTISP